MKKLLLSLCLLICGLHISAQSSQTPTHLVLEYVTNQDSEISFLLVDKPKINFSNNQIHIITSENSFSTFDYYLKRIYYSSKLSTVDNITEINNSVEQQGDMLCFSTSQPNSYISITDFKGTIIMSETIDSGCYYFPMSNLSTGIYIAKINNSTIKFIKR